MIDPLLWAKCYVRCLIKASPRADAMVNTSEKTWFLSLMMSLRSYWGVNQTLNADNGWSPSDEWLRKAQEDCRGSKRYRSNCQKMLSEGRWGLSILLENHFASVLLFIFRHICTFTLILLDQDGRKLIQIKTLRWSTWVACFSSSSYPTRATRIYVIYTPTPKAIESALNVPKGPPSSC